MPTAPLQGIIGAVQSIPNSPATPPVCQIVERRGVRSSGLPAADVVACASFAVCQLSRAVGVGLLSGCGSQQPIPTPTPTKTPAPLLAAVEPSATATTRLRRRPTLLPRQPAQPPPRLPRPRLRNRLPLTPHCRRQPRSRRRPRLHRSPRRLPSSRHHIHSNQVHCPRQRCRPNGGTWDMEEGFYRGPAL